MAQSTDLLFVEPLWRIGTFPRLVEMCAVAEASLPHVVFFVLLGYLGELMQFVFGVSLIFVASLHARRKAAAKWRRSFRLWPGVCVCNCSCQAV